MAKVELTVNGKKVAHEVEDRTLLADFLRDTLGLTGTHIGCDTSQCGCCTIHLNGKAVKSCTMRVATVGYFCSPDSRSSISSIPAGAGGV